MVVHENMGIHLGVEYHCREVPKIHSIDVQKMITFTEVFNNWHRQLVCSMQHSGEWTGSRAVDGAEITAENRGENRGWEAKK